jgi:uncharacterized protein (TIRG00374 family)
MLRKIVFALLILLAAYFIYTNQAEVEQVLMTLQKGDWRWLLLALIVHLAYLLNIGMSLKAIYRLLGMDEKIRRLTLLAAAANFVIVVAPSAGMGGIAVFAADAQNRGHPPGRASTAAAVYVFFDYLATLVVLVLGLFVLFRRNQLHTGEITAALVLAGLALGLGILLYLGTRSGERLGNALAWIGGLVNRVTRPVMRRDYFNVDVAYEFGLEAAEGLREARKTPEGFLLPFALGLSTKALMMTILFLMFLAFGQDFTLGTLIAGYSLGYLFTIVSPTPSGVGFVETAMTLALTSLRIPFAPAALIVLGYRGFTLWLTMAYGMIAMRWVGRPPTKEEPHVEPVLLNPSQPLPSAESSEEEAVPDRVEDFSP